MILYAGPLKGATYTMHEKSSQWSGADTDRGRIASCEVQRRNEERGRDYSVDIDLKDFTQIAIKLFANEGGLAGAAAHLLQVAEIMRTVKGAGPLTATMEARTEREADRLHREKFATDLVKAKEAIAGLTSQEAS